MKKEMPMKNKATLLCLGFALLFMAAVFRPGYRIIVNDRPLPGIYEPDLVLRCNRAAIRAAEEIIRDTEDPPYTLIPVYCLKYTQAEDRQLWGLLLESYEGVEKLYTVSLGDQYIGTVSNLRELYLIKNEYLAVWSPETKLTIREIYTYAGAETPQEEVRNAFRQLSLPNLPV